MNDRLPWSTRGALGVLLLVFGGWLAGFALLALGSSLGWLGLGLAAWMTVGLLATVVRGAEGAAG